MILDDVPAELRRRLGGTISYALQPKPRTPEELEPLLELVEDEDVLIEEAEGNTP